MPFLIWYSGDEYGTEILYTGFILHIISGEEAISLISRIFGG